MVRFATQTAVRTWIEFQAPDALGEAFSVRLGDDARIFFKSWLHSFFGGWSFHWSMTDDEGWERWVMNKVKRDLRL
jgi:hypothetical protein